MPKFAIELDWKIDDRGYSARDHGKWGHSIVRNGGILKSVRPFASIDSHYRQFAAVRTRDDLLKFVNTHGLLDDADPGGSDVVRTTTDDLGRVKSLVSMKYVEGERVEHHLVRAALFGKALAAKQSGRHVSRSVGQAIFNDMGDSPLGAICLAPNIPGGLKFIFRAESLMAGLWIQLAQSLLGESIILSCDFCGDFFAAGVGSGRRADAKFCTKEHQIQFNSRKRAKKMD